MQAVKALEERHRRPVIWSRLLGHQEGAACFAALKSLRSDGKIRSGERVVVFNTGSGIKYLEAYDRGSGG